MWAWKKLANSLGIWEEKWSGSSKFNSVLKILSSDNNLRIISGGYTQSKKVEKDSFKEGYWFYQSEAVDLSSIQKPKILILGFGGGTIGTLLKTKYPTGVIDGVEIDPLMIKLGEKYLGLKAADFNILIKDARDFIRECQQKYDYICIDLYLGSHILKEVENERFYQQVKLLLNSSGRVSLNRIFEKGTFLERMDSFAESGQDYRLFQKLFTKTFRDVKVIEVPSPHLAKNYIFVGGK